VGTAPTPSTIFFVHCIAIAAKSVAVASANWFLYGWSNAEIITIQAFPQLRMNRAMDRAFLSKLGSCNGAPVAVCCACVLS
jgi:hypothetical protein